MMKIKDLRNMSVNELFDRLIHGERGVFIGTSIRLHVTDLIRIAVYIKDPPIGWNVVIMAPEEFREMLRASLNMSSIYVFLRSLAILKHADPVKIPYVYSYNLTREQAERRVFGKVITS